VLTHPRLVPVWIAFVLASAAAESAATTPRLLCYPVMPGDTVTAISLRLTRDPQSWLGSGFQLFDPASGRFVAKDDYRYIRTGWHACVSEPLLARAGALRPPAGRMGWWPLVLVGAAMVTALLALQSSLERRKATSQALEHFGAAFIREFERPLIDERGAPSALRTQLALSPDKRTLEVLLAPADGRRYPNLADHRTNVEYDVTRVVGLLNDRRFTCGPLRARGSWVAIPFRLSPDLRKEGEA
jgi:hypothetical protein